MCRGLRSEVPESGSARQRNLLPPLARRSPVVDDEKGRDAFSSHMNRNSKSKRRTQLACVRCRKRKIKCSGEIREGLGCEKCQLAKTTDCVFLRAGSTVLEPRVDGVHLSMVNGTPVTALSSSPYDSQTGQSHPSTMPFAFDSICEISDAAPAPSTSSMSPNSSSNYESRGSMYNINNTPIEDIYRAPYNYPSSPQQYFQLGSSLACHTSFSRISSPRAWEPPVSEGSTIQTAVVYNEADTASSLIQQHPSSPSEVSSLFPTVNILCTADSPIIGRAYSTAATSGNAFPVFSSKTSVSDPVASAYSSAGSQNFAQPMHMSNNIGSYFSRSSTVASPLAVKPDVPASQYYRNNTSVPCGLWSSTLKQNNTESNLSGVTDWSSQ